MIDLEADIEQVSQLFEDWADDFSNTRDINKRLAEPEKKRTVDRFKTKKDPDGRPWTRWQTSTVEAKWHHGGFSSGILVDSGDLRQSIQYKATAKEFVIGSDLDYAKYQQQGTREIPARPFLGFNNEIKDDVDHIIASIIERQ